MNVREYFREARSFAIYPDSAKFSYPVMGMTGEIGELIEKIECGAPKEAITKEIGDNFWYVVSVLHDAGIGVSSFLFTLTGLEPLFFNDLQYARLAIPDTPELPVIVHLGRLHEIAKKAIRDNEGVILPSKIPAIKSSVCGVTRFLLTTCSDQGINVGLACNLNLQKLESRQERGVLTGSGDDR